MEDGIYRKYEHYINRVRRDSSKALYKGLENESNDFGEKDILIIDPHKFTRKSRFSKNFVNMMVSNLPSWQGWPPRSNSIVCSESQGVASSYGRVYQVIPINKDTPIGICPDEDFWMSFSNLSDLRIDVSEFDEYLDEITRQFDIKLSQDNPKKLFSQLKDFQDALRLLPEKDYKDITSNFSENEKYILENFFLKDDVLPAINSLLHPISNGFKQTTFENFRNSKHNKEVWVNGPCILIASEDYDEDI